MYVYRTTTTRVIDVQVRLSAIKVLMSTCLKRAAEKSRTIHI